MMFKQVEEKTNIKFKRSFWDENKFGNKPDKFCVYRFSGLHESIASDNTSEILTKSYRISFFTKAVEKCEADCARIVTVLKSEGFDVLQTAFEDYEKDTKYLHFEFEAEIQLNESEEK